MNQYLLLMVITVLSVISCADNRGEDFRNESPVNPGGFPDGDVPQMIVLGSDDNTNVEGMNWILDFMASRSHKDGTSLRMSFYSNSRSSADWHLPENHKLVEAHKRAYNLGHELGNHTSNHAFCVYGQTGEGQIRITQDSIFRIVDEFSHDLIHLVGMNPKHIVGFRTPYLAWSDSVFYVINNKGFWYDCSITESRLGPGRYIWPFTMDYGASGTIGSWWTENHGTSVGRHPGLWQLPCYSFQAPDSLFAYMDSLAGRTHNGLITGLDYNMWSAPRSGWLLNKDQSLAVLKHTLKLNLEGNRTPMTIGMHSQYYADDFNGFGFQNIPSAADRRAVVEEFIDYALQFDDVWFVTGAQVIHYMRNPVEKEYYNPDNYLFTK
ncbi:polysaccharide deacetylase family protein [Alkalitalea saponilacus]|uniref:Polysaccharide deacetylase n=1 Tax=Alkalitalea saponilacus TaxID=889453 RepID=A0A1T5HTR7_9BACT|nr:polysaccharide deacetylase family protein [Alkalitalea saponilacus]ASB49973.1 hypothetical protein CDL62_12920 [Alkalitalea saponilacus]SKC24073.1 Polysaccharide deacetylase [Alkalitalea saponilacus]